MNQTSIAVNWVTERAKCSSLQAFEELGRQVKSDVESRNSVVTSDEMQYGVRFAFEGGPAAFFVAVFRGSERLERVLFERIAEGIRVKYPDSDRDAFVGVLTLSNDGECRLKVKDLEELTFWQFRKAALEHVFFILLASLRQ